MLNIALKMHSEWKEKIIFYVGIFTYISKSGSRAQLLNEINSYQIECATDDE